MYCELFGAPVTQYYILGRCNSLKIVTYIIKRLSRLVIARKTRNNFRILLLMKTKNQLKFETFFESRGLAIDL